MPLTPFHLGPALTMKAAARRHFSLRIFALAQIVIDVESVRAVLLSVNPLHGPLHSFVGATVTGLLAAVLGRHIFNAMNPRLRAFLRGVEGMPTWLVEEVVPITWSAAIVGGSVGGISHVLLDAVIHPDVSPFWPISPWNPFLVENSFYPMHYACALLGLMGIVVWLALARRTPRGIRAAQPP